MTTFQQLALEGKVKALNVLSIDSAHGDTTVRLSAVMVLISVF